MNKWGENIRKLTNNFGMSNSNKRIIIRGKKRNMETDRKKLKQETNTINAPGLKEMSFCDDRTQE